jgi:hypothetical protein
MPWWIPASPIPQASVAVRWHMHLMDIPIVDVFPPHHAMNLFRYSVAHSLNMSSVLLWASVLWPPHWCSWTHHTPVRCGWIHPRWHRTCSTWQCLTCNTPIGFPPPLIVPEVPHHQTACCICHPYPWRRGHLHCWCLATIRCFWDTDPVLVILPKPRTGSDYVGWNGWRRHEWNTPSSSTCCIDACYTSPRTVPTRIRWPWWWSWTLPPRGDGPKCP